MGRTNAVAACLALGTLGLVAAGCGSSSPAASPATTTTTGRAPAAFAAYRSCLEAHGVTLPVFGGFRGRRPGTGTSPQRPAGPPTSTTARPRRAFGFGQLTAKQRSALTACRSKLPAGTFAGSRRFGPGARGPNGNPAFAKYTACLKQHGVAFGSTSSSPAVFRKAQAACAKLLPTSRAAETTTGSS